MSWHRFVEHMRGTHNDSANVHTLNELVAIALSDDVAITKRMSMECLVASPTIFIRCTDCHQLCFGRQGLIRHRGQCSEAIPFEVKYSSLLVEPTDHVFTTVEKGEIEVRGRCSIHGSTAFVLSLVLLQPRSSPLCFM